MKNFSICLQSGPIQSGTERARPFGPYRGRSDQKLGGAIKNETMVGSVFVPSPQFL